MAAPRRGRVRNKDIILVFFSLDMSLRARTVFKQKLVYFVLLQKKMFDSTKTNYDRIYLVKKNCLSKKSFDEN